MQSAAVVRRAILADAQSVCVVVRRSIAELCVDDHQGDAATLSAWLANKTEENVAQWITSRKNVALVAELDAAIAGFALMNDLGEILLLYVSPDYRLRAVSTELLRNIEQEANALGIRRLTLESTLTAERFYRARGFVTAGQPQEGFGVTVCVPLATRIAP